MDGESVDLLTTYEAALRRYVEDREEIDLEAAYAFSRAAFGKEMTVLDVVDLHRNAVARILRHAASPDKCLVDDTFSFLAEALSVFEMAQRGFWEAHHDAARERAIALSLQHELLPREIPHVAGLDIAVRYLPGESENHAGGDWYDVFQLEASRVGLVVGDVSGHGVAAAAAMGRLRMGVLAYARSGAPPAEVITRLDLLLDQLATGEVATLVYVVADPDNGTLTLSNAGHPPPLTIDANGDPRLVPIGHARLIGVRPSLLHRDQDTTRIDVGDHLLLYTDGLIEPLERAGHNGVVQLQESTRGFAGTADDLCDHVLSELAPRGADDDICIVAATLTGAVDGPQDPANTTVAAR